MVLAVFLIIAFAFGGGSREDTESLMFLLPLSALVLGYGLLTLQRAQLRDYAGLFALAAACLCVPIAQLIPLPPSLFHALPGREIIVAIDHAIGNGDASRPISMDPFLTRNALWSLLPPLAVLVLGVQLSGTEQRKLLPIILMIGIISAGLGYAQTMSDPGGMLFFYDDTNFGMPVGLFGSRNHHAMFLACLIPMLAVWVRTSGNARDDAARAPSSLRFVGAVFVGFCLLVITLLTGSRAGAFIALVGAVTVPLILYRKPVRQVSTSASRSQALVRRFRQFLPAMAGVASLVLVGATIVSNRALSIDRLFTQSVADDLRVTILPTVLAMIHTFGVWGSGAGTFLPVYRMYEPDALIMPRIMNHVHDDWLEVVMTAGIPGALILAAAVGLCMVRLAVVVKTRNSALPPYHMRAGLLIMIFLAIGSLVEYHLRTPSLACLLVVAAIWMCADPETLTRGDPFAGNEQDGQG